MLYFKNAAGEVFAYDTQAERDEFGAEDLAPMNSKDVELHLNPPPLPKTVEQVEAARLRAYADPLTGSDRMFAEASRMQLMGEPEFEASRAAAIDRFAEIQAANPWP